MEPAAAYMSVNWFLPDQIPLTTPCHKYPVRKSCDSSDMCAFLSRFHHSANPIVKHVHDTFHIRSHLEARAATYPDYEIPSLALNFSTSLEASLGGLRGSVVAVSTSVDCLVRRNGIALTNESMRLNVELGSLKYAVRNIRLQGEGESRLDSPRSDDLSPPDDSTFVFCPMTATYPACGIPPGEIVEVGYIVKVQLTERDQDRLLPFKSN
ncbi:hypothetical protein DFH29DRAFT_1072924 [Suillus ampliporus]|nr:hypothetical protein DFH29DRAFT_1072924 [Suillus ampliporus]